MTKYDPQPPVDKVVVVVTWILAILALLLLIAVNAVMLGWFHTPVLIGFLP